MTFTSGPWDGLPFSEAQWRGLVSTLAPDHFEVIGSVQRSLSDRTVTVSHMKVFVNGGWAEQSGTDVIVVPEPASGLKRIDWLAMEYNPTANSITPVLVQGQEAVNPVEPDLTMDEADIWQFPFFQIGPYGAGPIAQAPARDWRVRRSFVRSITERGHGFRLGGKVGDLFYTPPTADDGGQFYYHDGTTLLPYLNVRKPEVFSTSDSGYPRRVEGFTNQITNSLTVPARDYDRALMISATHWLRVPAGPAEYDSWMRIDGNHVREFRHPREQDISSASSASMSVSVTLPARRSMRILTGFTRATSSGAAATSSSTRAANNINVLATPA